MKRRRWRLSMTVMFCLFAVSAVATGSFTNNLIPGVTGGGANHTSGEVLAADGTGAEQNSQGGAEGEIDGAEKLSPIPEDAVTDDDVTSILSEKEEDEVSPVPAADGTGAEQNTQGEAEGEIDGAEKLSPIPAADGNTASGKNDDSDGSKGTDETKGSDEGMDSDGSTGTDETGGLDKTEGSGKPAAAGEAISAPTPTPALSFEYVVSNVTEFVNIREAAGTDSEIAGKLYRNSYGRITERGEEWTRITSGSVSGYVKNEYLLFDESAVKALQQAEAILIEITAGTVNLRTAPGTDSEIIREVTKGQTFIAEPEKNTAEWTAVQYEGGPAYLSTQYVTRRITMSTAVSLAEEKAAAEAAALAKALEEAKKYIPTAATRTAVSLNDEDLFLLAIVVEMEAASESYEGKLAVANVVMNRLLSGAWGKTLSDVIYAPNQFSGANSGRIETYSTRVSADSKKAAVAAAAGENNIGDYMYFRMHSSKDYSSYSKYYILGNHIFYAR